jgi:dGTPase
VADMEDAIGKGVISFRDVREFLLENLSTDAYNAPHSVHTREVLTTIDEKVFSVNRFFVDLRDKLIDGARHTFVNNYDEIMAGTFNQDLFQNSWAEDLYVILRKLSEERIYDNKGILRLEIAGYTTLTYLLDSFVPSLVSYDTNRQLDYVELKKIGIISESQKRSYHYFAEGKSEVEKLYLRLLLATDFISGMTDSYSHRLYLDMVGI